VDLAKSVTLEMDLESIYPTNHLVIRKKISWREHRGT